MRNPTIKMTIDQANRRAPREVIPFPPQHVPKTYRRSSSARAASPTLSLPRAPAFKIPALGNVIVGDPDADHLVNSLPAPQ
jgi:hypothetical protein